MADDRRATVLTLLLALAATASLIVTLELVMVPWERLTSRRFGAAVGPALSLLWPGLMKAFAPLVGLQLLIVLFAARSWAAQPKLLAAATSLVAAAMTVVLYVELTRSSVFEGFLPLLAWLIVVFGVVAIGTALMLGLHQSRRRAAICAVIALSTGLAGIAVHWLAFRHRYPTFHVMLVGSAWLMLWVGFANVMNVFRIDKPVALVVAVVVVAQGLAIALAEPTPPQLSALVREYSVLGSTASASSATGERVLDELPCAERAPPMDLDAALAVFAKHVGLPALPDDLRTNDYNVLLVLTDTVRYDQTSEAHPELGTTPMLSRLAGGLRFSRAYAPSPSTGPTVCSMLAMTYPSHVPMMLQRGREHHVGPVPDGPSVAQLLARSGFDSFAVLHTGVAHCVANGRGIADYELVSAREHQPKTDEVIATRAIAQLKARRGQAQPFFGWVFFQSPHDDYLRRGEGTSPMERYRSEIAYADQQLGRLLDALDDEQRAKTIIIVTSDHGEEFGEHGRYWHSQTNYVESTHVPLVVRIPGMTGANVATPTSLIHLFPWLFLRGDENLRQAAEKVIRDDLAPMMELTAGAIVSEKLKWGEMRIALTFDRYRIHHDVRIQSFELYDLNDDPAEKRDIYWEAPQQAALFRERLDAYLKRRGCERRYTITEQIPEWIHPSRR